MGNLKYEKGKKKGNMTLIEWWNCSVHILDGGYFWLYEKGVGEYEGFSQLQYPVTL